MKVKKLLPQRIINYSKHFPQAVVANLKFGFPGQKLKVIGVTGTDGKTTTVNMIYSILKTAGKKVSMISTVYAQISGKKYDTGFHVTSVDSFMLQNFLNQSFKSGDEFMVLEITSHALDQFREWGVRFELGVITNITHEHLDYHGTFDEYVKTKAKLIRNVKVAVLNFDDPSFKKLRSQTSGEVVSFGLTSKSSVNPRNFPLKLKLLGKYNLYNALASVAVCLNLGIDSKIIKTVLEGLTPLIGRMEEIKNNLGFKVFVDFAHTPNALKQALCSLRTQTKSRLIAVFGAAAERDESKRPVMGKVAAQEADIVILTSEDPRFEPEEKIINEIAKGAYEVGFEQGKNLFKQPDRAQAINMAVKMAKKGDIVAIFGKGHERSISIKGVERPWSDQEQAALALKYAR